MVYHLRAHIWDQSTKDDLQRCEFPFELARSADKHVSKSYVLTWVMEPTLKPSKLRTLASRIDEFVQAGCIYRRVDPQTKKNLYGRGTESKGESQRGTIRVHNRFEVLGDLYVPNKDTVYISNLYR
jgi:hypothetical protein